MKTGWVNSRPLVALAALICGTVLAAQAHAALIAYEGFTGLNTGDLTTQGSGSGWSGAWTKGGSDAMTYSSSGLTYSKGGIQELVNGGTARQSQYSVDKLSYRSLSATVGGAGTDLWVSFLVDNLVTANGGSWFGFSLNSGSTEKVYTGYGNNENDWLSVIEGTGNTVVATGNTIDVGTTHLIVYHLTFAGGVTTENLYIDPVPSSGPLPTGYTATASGTNNSTFTVNGVRIGGAQQMLVDEIRIGTTFQDVVIPVPEPAALVLGVMGLAVTARGRSRRAGQRN